MVGWFLDAGKAVLDAGHPSLDAGGAALDAGLHSLDAGGAALDAGLHSLDAGHSLLDVGLQFAPNAFGNSIDLLPTTILERKSFR
ncbi:hypothetical protein [Sporosarcina luteola]|uniref:hypothetical protein n=1 Tax=Sporosarcina luteola TaxID=582850 RepID=UPI002040E3AC|nr:hypothetical protein [Sporosarcina luteola]MCM3709267.1 hypothetical protein [Sporosarcina luteola]